MAFAPVRAWLLALVVLICMAVSSSAIKQELRKVQKAPVVVNMNPTGGKYIAQSKGRTVSFEPYQEDDTQRKAAAKMDRISRTLLGSPDHSHVKAVVFLNKNKVGETTAPAILENKDEPPVIVTDEQGHEVDPKQLSSEIHVHWNTGAGTCPNECSGNGLCGGNGTCECRPGFFGEDCSKIVTCPHDCYGNGECLPSGVCRCRYGFKGDDCAETVIPRGSPTVVVNQVEPTHGPAAGGYKMQITGNGFGTAEMTHSVLIGGSPCLNVEWKSGSSMECQVPPGIGRDHEVRVSVFTFDGMGTSQPAQLFSYDAPVVHSVEPSFGSTDGGYVVTITGLNFGSLDRSAAIAPANGYQVAPSAVPPQYPHTIANPTHNEAPEAASILKDAPPHVEPTAEPTVEPSAEQNATAEAAADFHFKQVPSQPSASHVDSIITSLEDLIKQNRESAEAAEAARLASEHGIRFKNAMPVETPSAPKGASSSLSDALEKAQRTMNEESQRESALMLDQAVPAPAVNAPMVDPSLESIHATAAMDRRHSDLNQPLIRFRMDETAESSAPSNDESLPESAVESAAESAAAQQAMAAFDSQSSRFGDEVALIQLSDQLRLGRDGESEKEQETMKAQVGKKSTHHVQLKSALLENAIISAAIGDTPCTTVTRVSDSEIYCKVPPGIGGPLAVSVTAGGQTTHDLKKLFAYNAPTVDRVEPSRMSSRHPTNLTITGSNYGPLSSDVKVFIGVSQCQYVWRTSATTLVCRTTPEGLVAASGASDRPVAVEVGGQSSKEDTRVVLVIECENDCNGNGECTRQGVCNCRPGYSGTDCSGVVSCPNNCSSNGECLNSGLCSCRPGFFGEDCAKTVKCPADCSGNGQCLSTGECLCRSGFVGADCSQTDFAKGGGCHNPAGNPIVELTSWKVSPSRNYIVAVCGSKCKKVCGAFAEVFEKASALAACHGVSSGHVALAGVDGDRYPDLAEHFQVEEYPTLVWIPKGHSTPALIYSGDSNDHEALSAWIVGTSESSVSAVPSVAPPTVVTGPMVATGVPPARMFGVPMMNPAMAMGGGFRAAMGMPMGMPMGMGVGMVGFLQKSEHVEDNEDDTFTLESSAKCRRRQL